MTKAQTKLIHEGEYIAEAGMYGMVYRVTQVAG